ncbi:MAG: ABC transporter permease, partial [Roseburia sp.]|nr:ABC transporter permease [Roseburia sp.]
MSRQQVIRFVRLEAVNWCKTAIPIGIVLSIIATWGICAALRYGVGDDYREMTVFGISPVGILSGVVIGLVTVLIAAQSPAKRAAKVSPVTAAAGNAEYQEGGTCGAYGDSQN